MRSSEDFLATFALAPGYLNWAAFGPLSTSVQAASHRAVDALTHAQPGAIAEAWTRVDDARGLLATLLGADVDEVTLHNSSTHALMQAFYGIRGAVVAATSEFPSVSMTIHRAAAAMPDVETRWITPDGGVVTPDAVRAALDDSVSAVAVSHVDFRTGHRVDLEALREAIGEDRLLIVDAVQSFGVVDVDWTAADVVVGHGYKWLRAGRGTGFARFSARARERITPVLSGITGTANPGLYVDELPDPAPTAKAYAVSAPDLLAADRLATALQEVSDTGVAAIEGMLATTVDAVIEIADRHGIPVVSPREREHRAGIVSLAPRDPSAIAQALTDAGVAVTARGATVRVAPHAGTDDETLRMFDEALGQTSVDSR